MSHQVVLANELEPHPLLQTFFLREVSCDLAVQLRVLRLQQQGSPAWTHSELGIQVDFSKNGLWSSKKMCFCKHTWTGWWLSPTPLKNMKVGWDDNIPNMMGKINHVPNHQGLESFYEWNSLPKHASYMRVHFCAPAIHWKLTWRPAQGLVSRRLGMITTNMAQQMTTCHVKKRDPEMSNRLSSHLPSGNLLHSYWKWPFIVDFPIENGDFKIVMLVYQRVCQRNRDLNHDLNHFLKRTFPNLTVYLTNILTF